MKRIVKTFVSDIHSQLDTMVNNHAEKYHYTIVSVSLCCINKLFFATAVFERN